jgi:hypothetical protein
MSGTPRVQRIAERLIRASCRRLPGELRAERCREWSAELPAILHDDTIRSGLIRSMRALSYSVGVSTATRRLSRGDGRSRSARASGWRDGAIHVRPGNLAVRVTVGLLAWLLTVFLAVSLLRAFPPHGWAVAISLVPAAAFAVFCLADLARADAVRYLPKWAWALICVAQIPSGGIAYLSVGRVGQARPAPPGSAQLP